MFRDSRHSLLLPDFSDPFLKRLYATYISYLEENDFAYQLTIREDARGELAEFLKQAHFGQIFISRTKPGITRGNHFHHTKVEKFLVVDGDAAVRFRRIDGTDIIEYRVSGKDFKVVDIPPGYTHSIENVGPCDLITLFWADELFDPKVSDTYSLYVVEEDKRGKNS
jgi:UDP-2-acetamido-2,6-beta-L-arabino-hexul-4-ose reductase